MHYSEDYLKRFVAITRLHKFQYLRPEIWIEKWDQLVCDLETGYTDIAAEFYNDLDTLRGPIDYFLEDIDLLKFKYHLYFINSIIKIDNRFVDASFEDISFSYHYSKWWSRRILKKASVEYADSFDENTRSKIEIVCHHKV